MKYCTIIFSPKSINGKRAVCVKHVFQKRRHCCVVFIKFSQAFALQLTKENSMRKNQDKIYIPEVCILRWNLFQNCIFKDLQVQRLFQSQKALVVCSLIGTKNWTVKGVKKINKRKVLTNYRPINTIVQAIFSFTL